MIGRQGWSQMVFVLGVLLAHSSSLDALLLQTSTTSVTVSDLTPGDAVVLVWMAKVPQGHYQDLYSGVEELVDDDLDGSVTFTPTVGVPPKSVWIAIDLTSGAAVATGSVERPISMTSFSSSAVVTAGDGTPEALALVRSRALVAVVRPRVGFWQGMVADGSGADYDAAVNNVVHLSPAGLTEAGSTTELPPLAFAPDDVLVAIDPGSLEVSIWTAPAGGGQ